MNQPLIERARRKGLTVHGSVYPGANPKQDSRYAQILDENAKQKRAKTKQEAEAAA